ncbi:hypothetical protein [Schleiferia thermophila]|nr:hypothetical protein [Schleiferia thermophila]
MKKNCLLMILLIPIMMHAQPWSIKSGYSKKHFGHYTFVAGGYERQNWNFELGLNYFINVYPTDNQGNIHFNRGWAFNNSQRFGLDLSIERNWIKNNNNRLYFVNNFFVNYIAHVIDLMSPTFIGDDGNWYAIYIYNLDVDPSFNWMYSLGLGFDGRLYDNLFISMSALPGIVFYYYVDDNLVSGADWLISKFFRAVGGEAFTITYNVSLKYKF